MLFRRFSLVTACIALMGILVLNLIESTQNQKRGFALESRLEQWKLHDAKKSCEDFQELCDNEFGVKSGAGTANFSGQNTFFTA